MPDVETRLREYGDHLESFIAPFDVETLSVPPVGVARPIGLRRGIIVLAAAAALVLIVGGGLAWLAGGRTAPGEPAGPVTTSPPTTATPPTTAARTRETVDSVPPTSIAPAAPTPPGPVALDGWSATALDPAVFPPTLGVQDVASGGPGLVAVGRTNRDDTQSVGTAAIWTSEDGLVWVRLENLDGVFEGLALRSVVTTDHGLVAVGATAIRDTDPSGRTVVLLSEDGLAWTRIEDAALVRAEMPAVTSGGPGLVGVGFDHIAPFDRAVWVSEDGTSWQAVVEPLDASTLARVPGGTLFLTSATRIGSTIVAGGDGGVFTSSDGISWSFERLRAEGTAFDNVPGARIEDVAAGSGGVVAVSNQAIWHSSNGLDWSRVFRAGNDASITSVAGFDEGFVAVGSVESEFDRGVAAAWTSPDGITWTRVPRDEFVFPAGSIERVTGGGPGIVAFGHRYLDAESGSFEPILWTWSPDR